jgi:O-antigen/teichoic acid export membrane protein
MSQLGNLGMSQALVKRVAECFEHKKYEDICRYYTSAVFSLAIVALTLFTVLTIFRQTILSVLGLSTADIRAFESLAIGVFAVSVSTFIVDVVSSLLSGLGRIDIYNYSQLVTQAVTVLLSVALLSMHWGLTGMLIGQACGYAIGLLFALIAIGRRLPRWPLRRRYFSIFHLKQLLAQGSLLASGWALALMFHPVNKILLAHAGRIGELPVYEIAVNLSMRLRNLFEASQRALMPETSRLISSSGFRPCALSKLLRSSLNGLCLAATPAYAVLFIGAETLTRVWLRGSFNPIVPGALRCFLIGTFLSLLGTPLYYVLIGAGKAQSILLANALQLSISITGVYVILKMHIFAPERQLFGVFGIADVALGVSTLVLLVTTLGYLRAFERRHEFANGAIAA